MIETLTLPTGGGMADRYVVSTSEIGVTIDHDLVDERGICEPASTATLYIVPEALPVVLAALARAARETAI